MKVKFWGTRGSLPAPVTAEHIREKIFKALKIAQGIQFKDADEIDAFIDNKLPFAISGSYGTNTSCVEITSPGDSYILLDAGSGIRDFAIDFMRSPESQKNAVFHIIMTHLHWDHIQGFPFFSPGFIPGNKIIIHAYHPDTEISFREQMKGPYFPIDFDAFSADIEFDIQPPCTPFEIDGIQITAKEQNHPGTSYGFRFEYQDTAIVFSTDSEHKEDAKDADYSFVPFFQDADILIFDAQYNITDATFSKANWGHSSNVIGLELAARSGVKCLALFHHEPTSSDAALEEFLYNTKMYRNVYHQEVKTEDETKHFPQKIILAYDGLVLEV